VGVWKENGGERRVGKLGGKGGGDIGGGGGIVGGRWVRLRRLGETKLTKYFLCFFIVCLDCFFGKNRHNFYI